MIQLYKFISNSYDQIEMAVRFIRTAVTPLGISSEQIHIGADRLLTPKETDGNSAAGSSKDFLHIPPPAFWPTIKSFNT
jgi:hypothetical protein